MGKKTQGSSDGRFGSTDSSKSEENSGHDRSDSITLESSSRTTKQESEQHSTISSDNKVLTQSNNSKSTSGIEKSLPSSQIVVCEEIFDEHSQPTNEEITEYAKKIGIDVTNEKHLLYIAQEGIVKQLPPEWKPCLDETLGDYYYFNFETGETQWNHPLDKIFREKVIQARLAVADKSVTLQHNSNQELLAENLEPHAYEIEQTENKTYTDISNTNDESLTCDSDKKEDHEMSLTPNKLAPLPPLGKGSSALGLSMNALPPLKRNSSLDKVKSMDKIGSSLSPLSSPKPKPASLTKRENLGRPSLGKTFSQTLSTDTDDNNRSLSLVKSPKKENQKKRLSFANSLASSGSRGSSELDSSPKRTLGKSILRMSPLKSTLESNQSLRGSLMQKDEKRIQFNLDEEKMELQSDDGSSYSAKNLGNHAEDMSSAKSEDGEDNDFMERHSLFDAGDLLALSTSTDKVPTISPSETIDESESSSSNGNIRVSNQRSTEGTPKLRLRGNQSSFLRPKLSQETSQSNSSHEDENDNQPRPTTRLSKLLSKSLSSEKSLSSSAKEDDKASDEQPTVVAFEKKRGASEFLKGFKDDEDNIVKPISSRTMSSMMSSLKQEDQTAGSSNIDSGSSSSNESDGKVELFKSLKFSDDALKQMNAKRQEIVGGRKIIESNKNTKEELNLGRQLSPNIAPKNPHIEIGSPLPRKRLVLNQNPENDTSPEEKIREVVIENKNQTMQPAQTDSEESDGTELSNEVNSESVVPNDGKDDIKRDNSDNNKHIAKNDSIPTINLEAAEEEKEKTRESLRQTYNDEITAFKLSLEKDMIREKEVLMKKFQNEITEEMKKLEGERFEKLKDYELQMTKELHRELDKFKDTVAKELEDKKKEIMINQEMVLRELEKSTNDTIQNAKKTNQVRVETNSQDRNTIKETIQQPKLAKTTNAKTKESGSTNNIPNNGINSVNSYPNPFSKQLEDLEKDIRKLRTQIGSGGSGSVSDYSSFSDGMEGEQMQVNSNLYENERNLSPDIESIVTYTEEDDINGERHQGRFPSQSRYNRNGMEAWPKHGNSNHGHRVANPYVGEEVQREVPKHEYHYNNQGDLNSSMQCLMDRITSLERMLNPVTQPINRYRPHTSKEYENLSFQRPKVTFGSAYNLQQYSAAGESPSQVANTTYPVPMVSNTFTRETFTGGPSNAWTVEEQIYKSKMWLQQRNQSMLPKP